jgi:hypothetical protein
LILSGARSAPRRVHGADLIAVRGEARSPQEIEHVEASFSEALLAAAAWK